MSVDNLGGQSPQALLCCWHLLEKHWSPLCLFPTPQNSFHTFCSVLSSQALTGKLYYAHLPSVPLLLKKYQYYYHKFQCLASG